MFVLVQESLRLTMKRSDTKWFVVVYKIPIRTFLYLRHNPVKESNLKLMPSSWLNLTNFVLVQEPDQFTIWISDTKWFVVVHKTPDKFRDKTWLCRSLFCIWLVAALKPIRKNFFHFENRIGAVALRLRKSAVRCYIFACRKVSSSTVVSFREQRRITNILLLFSGGFRSILVLTWEGNYFTQVTRKAVKYVVNIAKV